VARGPRRRAGDRRSRADEIASGRVRGAGILSSAPSLAPAAVPRVASPLPVVCRRHRRRGAPVLPRRGGRCATDSRWFSLGAALGPGSHPPATGAEPGGFSYTAGVEDCSRMAVPGRRVAGRTIPCPGTRSAARRAPPDAGPAPGGRASHPVCLVPRAPSRRRVAFDGLRQIRIHTTWTSQNRLRHAALGGALNPGPGLEPRS